MLTEQKVLKYVKYGLGFPTTAIELDDDQLKEIIIDFAIPEFSHWVPDIGTTAIHTNNDKYIVSGSTNRYYFFDEYGREIIEPVQVYYSRAIFSLSGIPYPVPFTSYDNLDEIMLKMWRGETAYEYSVLHMGWKFFPPNIIELHTGDFRENVILVRYKRYHAPDFSTIPFDTQTYFLDLALAYCKIFVGEQRSKYTNYSTTMGDIPINTDLRSEGQELRDKVIEELQTIPFETPLVVD